MSEFEYLAVLVSLILGLGIAHLLVGVGRMVHDRGHRKPDLVHGLWVGAVFWTLVLNWWVFYQAQTVTTWSLDFLLVVVVWSVLFFLLAVLLVPSHESQEESYRDVFERSRRWFMGLWVASSLADILLTAFRGDLLDPPIYLPFTLHWVVLGLLGIFIKSRRFHVCLAAYVLGVALTWSLVVRRFLGG